MMVVLDSPTDVKGVQDLDDSLDYVICQEMNLDYENIGTELCLPRNELVEILDGIKYVLSFDPASLREATGSLRSDIHFLDLHYLIPGNRVSIANPHTRDDFKKMMDIGRTDKLCISRMCQLLRRMRTFDSFDPIDRYDDILSLIISGEPTRKQVSDYCRLIGIEPSIYELIDVE